MTLQKHRAALALMILTVSLLSLAPTLTSADQQNQGGPIQINATGQATPLNEGKGTASPASLSLTGSAYTEGNSELKIQNLTGHLQIGSVNYTLTNGQGNLNKQGDIEITAKTNEENHKDELSLHGSLQGNNIAFNSCESKLSSLYFLTLAGQASISLNTSTSSSKSYSGDDHDNNKTATVTNNVTKTVNNTLTKTEFHNQTITQTVTALKNATVTPTQFNNQTITTTVTQTAVNTTVTKTVTVTTTLNTTTGP